MLHPHFKRHLYIKVLPAAAVWSVAFIIQGNKEQNEGVFPLPFPFPLLFPFLLQFPFTFKLTLTISRKRFGLKYIDLQSDIRAVEKSSPVAVDDEKIGGD